MTFHMTQIIGRTLRRVRAGERWLLSNAPLIADTPNRIALSSPAFYPGGHIPLRHAGPGVGDNVSPALTWSGIRPGVRELVLAVEDPDAPLPRPATHLIVAGIPPGTSYLPEGQFSGGDTSGLVVGRGGFGDAGYLGPRPVPGHGVHRYAFQLFAVDQPLGLTEGFSLDTLRKALHGRVLAKGVLTGLYER